MNIELTETEREYLAELLEVAHGEKLHELHHTDTADYKDILRRKIETIESLRARLGAPARVSA